MRLITVMILEVALFMGNLQLQAQQLSLEYNTELQTNFKGDYNWVNFLRLNGSVSIAPGLNISATTISISKTSQEPIIDDLQGFSNIEEENMALGISVLGAEYSMGNSTFFLGIRNVNEDYFTSPVTSLFVNSSCGIFPTISGNFDIANYPLSSWCFHYLVELGNMTVQTSLYEGLGHRRITGHDNVFTFSPGRDGLFSITSAEYDNNGSNYSMGCALYYGVHHCDEAFIEPEAQEMPTEAPKEQSKSLGVTPWINIEQRITDEFSILAQMSYSTSRANCRLYFGAGSAWIIGKSTLGIFADYAKYSACSEIAAEVTCQIPLTQILSIQPTLELIRTGHHLNVIGISRISITI